jgi:D-lactate dehydrogenase
MVGKRRPDVVFFEAFEEEQKLLKKLCPKRINAEFTTKTIQESSLKKAPSGLISVRTQSKIPLSWAKNLEGILTRSTGFEHILDYKKETKTCALLGYLPLYCARAVAEQAFLMIFNLLRRAKQQQESLLSFNRDGLTGRECQDKKVLVIGVGNIGAEIVDMAKGMRMKVEGVDIDRKQPSLEYTDLVSGLAWAEIVVCACSLTDETKNMLSYKTLRRVKKGTIFVNVARGEISPLKDLKRLLDEQILGGLGLDVYENEDVVAHYLRSNQTKPADEKTAIVLELYKRDNVILTPHNAFNTREALERKAQQSMESAASFLVEKKFPFFVPQRES